MVSLKDIASECQVSIATVSKALNDQGDISEATKNRISRIAKEMGYLPNAAARALKTNKSNSIGVLFVDEARSGLTHDYFSHILDSFKKTVEAAGYDMSFINSGMGNENRMSYLEHVKYRGYDGVVIACINFDSPEVVELVNSDIPVVTIDYIFNGITAIASNNEKGMSDLLHYIYEQGHRKIAYIHGASSGVTNARLATFYRVAEEYGADVPDEYIKEAAYRSIRQCASATKELLELPDPPTCILFPDDYSGMGGMNAIRENGYKIPEDISVAGFDGLSMLKHLEPTLTTVHQNTELMGQIAAENLIAQIESPKTALKHTVTVEADLIKGKTVRKITN